MKRRTAESSVYLTVAARMRYKLISKLRAESSNYYRLAAIEV